MDKRKAPDTPQSPRVRERGERNDEQPTWRRTRPRANQEIHHADLERSTERLEMLLGH